MLQCLIWFGFQHFFVGCVVWRQKVLKNGCSCYSNSWDISPNAKERRKSSIDFNITIIKSLKKKFLFFINVSF